VHRVARVVEILHEEAEVGAVRLSVVDGRVSGADGPDSKSSYLKGGTGG
jgi:hypothetical protein